MIEIGAAFPRFSLNDQHGRLHTLESQSGKWFVLYVYPKDDTPGCTIQGQGFTNAKSAYDAAGVTVFGLSPDSVESHKRFCDKFDFSHLLLADPKEQLLKALGIGQAEWNGNKYWNRTTFVVGPDGTVRRIYENVDPKGHETLILEDLRSLL